MFNKQYVQSALLSVLAALQLFLTSVGAVTASEPIPIPPCRRNPVVNFDPINFSNPTQIDNQWLPLVPGTKLVLKGEANRGGGVNRHRVVFTVTDLTKVLNGVRTVVVWDRDINNDKLLERELAFFAQDNDGNVWNLGEYPEEFNKHGKFLGAPSTWIAGLAGAEAGIHMLGNPQVGGKRYLQGWAPAIDFFDCAKVLRIVQETCVPFNCYQNVLLTDEVSPLEGGGHQRKYHASGVGIVQVGAVRDPEAETLVLTKIVNLNPEELAYVRGKALMMDKRGYWVSPDVYGLTLPAESPPAVGLDFETKNENVEYMPPAADDLDFEAEDEYTPLADDLDFEAENENAEYTSLADDLDFEAEDENQNTGQVHWIYLPAIFR